MYNDLEKAIHFATVAHKNQKRRNEDIDVIFHPYSVGMMLKNVGIDNEYVISGILHDIIEDTDYTYNDIKNEFGIKIADNVLKVSEDNNIKEWKTRKEKFLNKMESESDINILLLECADKLHNLMSDYNTYQKIGNNINSSASLEENKWWYNSLLKIIKRKCNNDLVSRFEKAVNYYYN